MERNSLVAHSFLHVRLGRCNAKRSCRSLIPIRTAGSLLPVLCDFSGVDRLMSSCTHCFCTTLRRPSILFAAIAERFAIFERSAPSSRVRSRCRRVRESNARCSSVGNPSNPSSHKRSSSATRNFTFLKGIRPEKSSKSYLGTIQVMKKVKHCCLSLEVMAMFINIGLIDSNLPMLFRAAASVMRGNAILSSISSSFLSTSATKTVPSDVCMAHDSNGRDFTQSCCRRPSASP